VTAEGKSVPADFLPVYNNALELYPDLAGSDSYIVAPFGYGSWHKGSWASDGYRIHIEGELPDEHWAYPLKISEREKSVGHSHVLRGMVETVRRTRIESPRNEADRGRGRGVRVCERVPHSWRSSFLGGSCDSRGDGRPANQNSVESSRLDYGGQEGDGCEVGLPKILSRNLGGWPKNYPVA